MGFSEDLLVSPSRERVPPHLRQYVVEQNLEEYNEIDQAVWRFVLLQLHRRLRDTAHASYVEGLKSAGIGVERIPRIAQMDALLQRVGWGAVCVDGFLPPLAFQEFQGLGILPISANVRSLDHLVYTPAPDILHEAAGHAPILSNVAYATYLRRIGKVGATAFSSREDDQVYQAIFTLSEVKEDPSAGVAQIEAAEHAVTQALSRVTWVSEAARIARLYWWTAEYGLIGSVDDYRLYGAGLLSSLLESHFCHGASVKKLPLSAACLEVAYDITRPQPQLFVARDFEQLEQVLREGESSFAYAQGGSMSLETAKMSGGLATLEFAGGAEVMGKVLDFGGAFGAEWVTLAGPGAWAQGGRIGARWQGEKPVLVPVAKPQKMHASCFGESEFYAAYGRVGGQVNLQWRSGICCDGLLERCWLDGAGFVAGITLKNFSVEHAGHPEHSGRGERLELGLVGAFRTVRAGGSCSEYYPSSQFSAARIPRPRSYGPAQKELLGLYEQALAGFRAGLGGQVAREFERIYSQLEREFPEEWLLRWNLLECLLKLRLEGELKQQLLTDLQNLEIRFMHRQPIASGLRYLERLVADGQALRD